MNVMEMKMGNLIAKKRKEKNMTQKDLAEKLFITDRAVSKWERNLSYPDIELLKDLSEILDVSISELINGEEIAKMTDTIIDKTIDEGIKIYRKKDISKFIKRFIVVLLLFFISIFTIINIVSEYNYGEVRVLDYVIWIPNSQVRLARKKTDKIIHALKEKDYKTLEDTILLKVEEDASPLEERLNQFYDTFSILESKQKDFYYNGRNYMIIYELHLKVGNEIIVIEPNLIAYKETVIFDSFAIEEDSFIDEYPEEWKILMNLFNYNGITYR